MTLRAVIADDEPLLRLSLQQHLADSWPELEIVGLAKDGNQAWTLIEQHRPEVAILDIRMPGLSGLEVARRMQDAGLARTSAIVFLTAFDQYAVEAFEREAIDYLVKPLESRRLEITRDRIEVRFRSPGDASTPDTQALLRTLQQLQGSSPALSRLTVSKGQAVHIVPVRDVLYFQAEDKYTTVVTVSDAYLIRLSLAELEARLAPDTFWRIHRSFLVQAACIDRMETNAQEQKRALLYGTSQSLPVSRRFARQLKPL